MNKLHLLHLHGLKAVVFYFNKNVFQWDAYRPLQWPCDGRGGGGGVCPGVSALGVCQGVSAWGVSAWGVLRCLPRGCLPRRCLPRGCLPRRCLPRECVCPGEGGVCPGEESLPKRGVCLGGVHLPLWTDRYLWKHNLSATIVADGNKRNVKVVLDGNGV